jgi:hypothetical protein
MILPQQLLTMIRDMVYSVTVTVCVIADVVVVMVVTTAVVAPVVECHGALSVVAVLVVVVHLIYLVVVPEEAFVIRKSHQSALCKSRDDIIVYSYM